MLQTEVDDLCNKIFLQELNNTQIVGMQEANVNVGTFLNETLKAFANVNEHSDKVKYKNIHFINYYW